MPTFQFVAAEERYYPTLNATLQPGDTFEADVNPDGPHFVEVDADGAPVEPVVEPPAEPSVDEPAQEG